MQNLHIKIAMFNKFRLYRYEIEERPSSFLACLMFFG